MLEKRLPRMRTAAQCYEELKKLDSSTCISKWCIYELARDNKVKYFRSGTKFYIDLDDLIEFFNSGLEQETKEK